MWATPNEATMSVIGLKSYNQYLFDNMVLPDGVDRTVLTNNIIYDCAELEVIYPDPYFMQFAIGEWSKRELPIWQKIHEMETAEYNPIENYDRYDSETESTGRERESTKSDTINSTSEAQSATVQGSTDVNRVAGFNSETLVTNNQSTGNNTSNSTNESTGASVQNTNDKGQENENRVKQLRSHGNIGVVTVAAMMSELVDVLPEVNTINYITESFKRRFCLLVY